MSWVAAVASFVAAAWNYVTANPSVIAAVAGALSSIAACIGLLVTATSMRRQTRSSDQTNYLAIMERVADTLRKVREATNSQNSEFETNEFLNLLEGLAQLYQHKSFGRSTREMVKSLLIETSAMIEDVPEIKLKFVTAVTSPTTFCALKTFQKRHRNEIARNRPVRTN